MEGTLRTLISQDWFTLISLGIVALITFLRLLNPQQFIAFASLAFTEKYFNTLERREKRARLFDNILHLVQFLIIPLILFILYQKQITFQTVDFWRLGSYFLFYMVFIIVKYAIVWLIGYLLNFRALSMPYHRHRIIYVNYLCLLAFCIIAFFQYTPIDLSFLEGIVLWISVLGLVFFILKIIVQYKDILISHPLYFILYFCALELAPYYILYKVLL